MWMIYSFKSCLYMTSAWLKHTAPIREADYIRHRYANRPFHEDSEEKGAQQYDTEHLCEFNISGTPQYCSCNGYVEQVCSAKGRHLISLFRSNQTSSNAENCEIKVCKHVCNVTIQQTGSLLKKNNGGNKKGYFFL